MHISDLSAVNAALNATSGVLLLFAYAAIRRHDIPRHRKLMLAAASTSAVFLISYVVYHLEVGSVRFEGPEPVRTLYLAILFTHVVLAVAIVPMVLRTLYLGLKRRDEPHRRLARWTFPLWLYVSVTGVIIYVMLYHLYPPGGIG